MEGQTLTVRCSYTPETGPYVSKSWCRQTSVKSCTRVVTTYQPQTAVEKSRHTIWDDPEAGFLVVNITDLQEDDSGSYWCGNYNASENTIFILRNITLVVSPGEAFLRKCPHQRDAGGVCSALASDSLTPILPSLLL